MRWRQPRWFLALAVGACLALRFPGLVWPPTPDEAGYFLVARHWDPRPDSLFAPYWVDRPPVLLGMFSVADLLGGPRAARWLVAGLAVALVLAAYRCGALLGGPPAARWATVAAVVWLGNPLLLAWAAKSEAFGVPWVMASCWLSLEALHRSRPVPRLLIAAAAGATGALAVGMKQNLFGGLVFGLVLLLGSVIAGRVRPRAALVTGLAALGGALVPVLAVVGWTASRDVPVSTLWQVLFGFRAQALAEIVGSPSASLDERVRQLLVLAVGSGIAITVAVFVWYAGRSRALHTPEAGALAAMLLVDTSGLVLGGSFYMPYLTALVPGAVLCVALLAGRRPGDRRRASPWTRASVVLASTTTVLLLTGFAVARATGQLVPTQYATGQAVGAAAREHDSILVLYGRPNVVQASGLAAPYRYLWSLPTRTLDPGLAQMRDLLAGTRAPTWLVTTMSVNQWGLDRSGSVRALIAHRYSKVATLCGHPVFRRRDLPRPPPPPVDCPRRGAISTVIEWARA